MGVDNAFTGIFLYFEDQATALAQSKLTQITRLHDSAAFPMQFFWFFFCLKISVLVLKFTCNFFRSF